MAVEDAMVSLLKTDCDCDVRPAYTTDVQAFPSIVVHAVGTRELHDTNYNLARYVDCEVRVITYAEPESLNTAREAHYKLLSDACHSLATADNVARLNAVGTPRVKFWSCYVKTDAGTIAESAYVTIIQVEVGATPQQV